LLEPCKRFHYSTEKTDFLKSKGADASQKKKKNKVMYLLFVTHLVIFGRSRKQKKHDKLVVRETLRCGKLGTRAHAKVRHILGRKGHDV
jgi:hypothetical protein